MSPLGAVASVLHPEVVRAVLRRPDLWVVAVRQARRLVPRRWWWRLPPLPLPSAAYVRFRLVTNYGGDGLPPEGPAGVARDVVAWLEWCRSWP